MDEPKTARGRQTKAFIVSAAAALMYERGVCATGIDDVLAAAGAGKGQLYFYFRDKEELVAAVVEHQLQSILDEQAEFRIETWTGMRAWLDSLVEGQRQRGLRGCPLGSLAAEVGATSDERRAQVGEAFWRWKRTLADGLAHMQRAGRLSLRADPHELADLVMAAIQGGYLLSTAEHDTRPMQRALSAAYGSLRALRPKSEGR